MVFQISLYIRTFTKSVVRLFNNHILIPVTGGTFSGICKPRILCGAFFVSSLLTSHKMEATNKISKGELIGRIFAHMDKLNLTEKMHDLFRKHGMDRTDLTELREKNQSDFDSWYKMHRRSKRLMSFTTYQILER